MKIFAALFALILTIGCEVQPDEFASSGADPARENEIDLRAPAARLSVKADARVAGLVDHLGERFEDVHEGGAVLVETGDVSTPGDAEMLASLGPINVSGFTQTSIAVDSRSNKTVYLYTRDTRDVFTKQFIEYTVSPTGQQAVELMKFNAVAEVSKATADKPLGK